MRLTHSVVLRFDHCHKPAKVIRLKDGAKASIGTAFLVGSHMQVMGLWNVASTSLDDVQDQIRRVKEKSGILGSVSDKTRILEGTVVPHATIALALIAGHFTLPVPIEAK